MHVLLFIIFVRVRTLFRTIVRQHVRSKIANFRPCVRAFERSVSGAENGAERAENRLKWSGAVSGQNLSLKICSTVKPLKVKSSKSILKVTTILSV